MSLTRYFGPNSIGAICQVNWRGVTYPQLALDSAVFRDRSNQPYHYSTSLGYASMSLCMPCGTTCRAELPGGSNRPIVAIHYRSKASGNLHTNNAQNQAQSIGGESRMLIFR